VARFEVCAHRWVHVAEPGYGAALVNDSTYGHDVTRTSRSDGGTTTTARLSLLRAPRYPDPEADQGEHNLRYALVVGVDIAGAIEAGYDMNLPMAVLTGADDVAPLLTLDSPAVVVEAVKLAEDRSGDVIVRLYEALGGRASARLRTSVHIDGARQTDLLERESAPSALGEVHVDGVTLRLRPFQIVTLRLTPER
jgi:alpha-mannosidase